MALVHNGTMTSPPHEDGTPDEPIPDRRGDGTGGRGDPERKRVFLVAAFPANGDPGPAKGLAEHVIAVIGMDGDHQRFEWVGDDQADSVDNPALVTPVRVPLGLPSPWHDGDDAIVTGLVQLADEQLGDGPVDDDLDHLLAELGRSRSTGPSTNHPEVG